MTLRTTAWVIKRYYDGLTTVHGAASWLIRTIDPESIDFEMTLIPDEVMPAFRKLALGYRHGEMISYGFDDEPTKAQIALIRDWFAKHPVGEPELEAVSVE